MISKILTGLALANSFASAQCIGSTFFKGKSGDFMSGLKDICFGMSVEEVQENSKPSKLVGLYNDYKRHQNIFPQEFWVDSVSYTNWFNDGGDCCFANVYHPSWITQNKYEVLGEVNSNDYGITTLYVGYPKMNDTTIAFTFYTGKSDKFYQMIKGKYENARRVSGLFDITMKVDAFLGTYFEHVLDSLSYNRNCGGKIQKNCMDEYGGNHGRTVVKTNDPNVIVIFDPANRNVHIRLTANMFSLAEAMHKNIQYKYDSFMKKRFTRLDE